jgi:hypothetical protein
VRTKEEILKDIEFVKNDITELRRIGGVITVALDDLEELQAELRSTTTHQTKIDELALSIRNELYGTSMEFAIARLLAILVGNEAISGDDILRLKGDLTEDAECKK